MKPELPRPAVRHDRVWLAPSWRDELLTPLQPAAVPVLSAWFAAGHPAVACRHEPGDPPGMSLGVTLPLSRSRARLGFALGHRAIRHVAPPLRLADVLGSAPPAWREPLSGIDRAAGDMGLSVSVYGSLAWEHMTGERYLREGSDVDLLVRPRTRAQLAGTLALLQRWDGHHGLRIDGEIVLGREHAVAWREMAGGRARVLVKTGTSVGLQPLGDLLSTLGEDRA